MTHLDTMGRWIAGLTWDAIPESARRAARIEMLDTCAAAHAAARVPEHLHLLAKLPYGAGASTVIATGARHAPADAAFLNAAWSMAQDYDSIIWMGHTAHSAVWASLAVAEHEQRDARAMITAIVAGNEIAGRLGASSALGPLNGQMWTFIHLVGAAAAAASLLKLSPAQASHALAIALAQPTYALQPAFFGPTSKLLAAAIPTQIGVQAAYLANNGMTGSLGILDDRRGFWHTFSFQPLPEMLDGLGELWAIDTLELKSAPCCHYFQTACEAATQLTGGKRAEHVAKVKIATTKVADEVTRFAREYTSPPDLTPIGASFDLAVAVAIVLESGRFTGDESQPEWLAAHAPALREWYGKIEIAHDPALTARILDGARAIPAGRRAIAALGAKDWLHLVRRYRAHYGSSLLRGREALGWLKVARREAPRVDPGLPLYFPNRVTIERTGGSIDQLQIDLPAGSIAAPSIDRVLREKWMREVAPRLGDARASDGLAKGLAIEGAGLASFVAAITSG